MCRNIKPLFNFAPPATRDEVHASALQYVRKVTGMSKPTQANAAAFEAAVEQITELTWTLVTEQLQTTATPKSREAEAEKARARGRKRDDRTRQRLLAELGQG